MQTEIEVQLADERSEWAFAVYVMHATDGCLSSHRFDYDRDTPGDKMRARHEARACFEKTKRQHPLAGWYDDTTGAEGRPC